MINLLIFLFLVSSPVNSYAIGADVQVAANTWAMKIEQKLQTLKMVQMVMDLKNSYQTARLTYDVARAGIEKAFNKKEWEALAEYHSYRLKQMANAEPDPYDSSLYQTLESLDAYVKEYARNTKLYSNIEQMSRSVEKVVDTADNALVTGIKSNTPLGAYYDLSGSLDSKTSELASMRETNESIAYLKEEVNKSKVVIDVAGYKVARSVQLLEESDKLRRVLFYAEREYSVASERLSRDLGTAMQKKDAHQRYERAKQVLEDIKQRRSDIRNEMGMLTEEIESLNSDIDERNSRVKMSAAVVGVEKMAEDIAYNRGLSTGSGNEGIVLGIQKSVLTFLFFSMVFAFLWHGLHLSKNQTDEALPVDAIVGFVIAVAFLAPVSPASITKIAKTLSIVVDGTESTIYKNTLREAGNRFVHNWPLASTFARMNEEKDTKIKSGAVSKVMQAGSSALKLGGIVTGGLSDTINNTILFMCSLLGMATLMIAMSVRIGVYWILMGVAPIIIALAPLSYARKHLIPRWGAALLAVILWGPIAKTILTVCQRILSSSSSALSTLNQENMIFGIMTSSIDGLLIAVLMIVSPFIAFHLANASFEGLAGGAMGIAAKGAGFIANNGIALGSFMTNLTGDGASGLGKKLINYSSKTNSPTIGKVGGMMASLGGGIKELASHTNAFRVDLTPSSVSLVPNKANLFKPQKGQ